MVMKSAVGIAVETASMGFLRLWLRFTDPLFPAPGNETQRIRILSSLTLGGTLLGIFVLVIGSVYDIWQNQRSRYVMSVFLGCLMLYGVRTCHYRTCVRAVMVIYISRCLQLGAVLYRSGDLAGLTAQHLNMIIISSLCYSVSLGPKESLSWALSTLIATYKLDVLIPDFPQALALELCGYSLPILVVMGSVVKFMQWSLDENHRMWLKMQERSNELALLHDRALEASNMKSQFVATMVCENGVHSFRFISPFSFSIPSRTRFARP
jgi:hypothetical protein